MSSKQCGNCHHATRKPPIKAACNNDIKSINQAEPMLYNAANMPFCNSFKPCYKGGKHG